MGEVVLITGCSRGIGLGLVDYFAKAGFKVKKLSFGKRVLINKGRKTNKVGKKREKNQQLGKNFDASCDIWGKKDFF